MDLLKVLAAAVLAALGVGCRSESSRPVAGLHSAAAPIWLRGERLPLVVGSQLRADAHLTAGGPAMVEYFASGAVRFLSQSEELDVGEAPEARLVSTNLAQARVTPHGVEAISPVRQPVHVRYLPPLFEAAPRAGAPKSALTPFFAAPPLGPGATSAPKRETDNDAHPPSPHVHAASLGGGGPRVQVSGGSVAAEAPDFATELLLDGAEYDVGDADRLFVPRRVTITLTWPGSPAVDVDGPVEVHLR